ncbi:MAG TPA: SDR family NAD(P)-dependent oxidoreductase [Anaerolineales bacterium]
MSEKKIVLITGASSGNGQETARLFVKAGYIVYGTSRNPAEQEQSDDFKMLPLDIRSDESVKNCVETVISQMGRLDVLINNAGYVVSGAIEETTLEQAKDLFETNFFGVMRMCQAVLPFMRKQRQGYIINISSLVGLNPIPFWGLYNASKFALEGFTETLRHELKPLNISVALVEPGFVKTKLAHSTQFSANLLSDYEPSRKRAWARIHERENSGIESRSVAETILKIVESKAPKLRHLLGKEVIYYRLRQLMPATIFENATRDYWNLDGKTK